MGKIRIVITIDGGIVQNVFADADNIEAVILDADVEGAEDEEVIKFEDGSDSAEYAFTETEVSVDPNFVTTVADLCEKAGRGKG